MTSRPGTGKTITFFTVWCGGSDACILVHDCTLGLKRVYISQQPLTGSTNTTCNVLFCNTVLYCTVLYCTVLYCTVLYCTVLYCTVLFCTILYCTLPGRHLLREISTPQLHPLLSSNTKTKYFNFFKSQKWLCFGNHYTGRRKHITLKHYAEA